MLGLRDDRRDGQDEESKGIVEGRKAGSGIRLRGWYGMKKGCMKLGWREKEVDGVMKGWWAEGGFAAKSHSTTTQYHQIRMLINT